MKISSTAQVSAQLVQVRSSARSVTFCVRATCEASDTYTARSALCPDEHVRYSTLR